MGMQQSETKQKFTHLHHTQCTTAPINTQKASFPSAAVLAAGAHINRTILPLRAALLHCTTSRGLISKHDQPGECLSLSTAEQLLWTSVYKIKGRLIPTSQHYSESWNQTRSGIKLSMSRPGLECRPAVSLQPELQAELCWPKDKSKPAPKGKASIPALVAALLVPSHAFGPLHG